MIELSLLPAPDYDADADAGAESAPAAAIEHTYFVVLVRLNIDGQELLAFPGVYSDRRPLPALGFASQLLRTVSELGHGESGTVTLEDGGVLSIARDGDHLAVASSLAATRVTVLRSDLLGAARALARVACDYVLSVSPAMATHASWRDWCPEVP
ncbi:hypothetical protein SacmaDRAFT_3835 [Saccharomonospora marina XMU15]|uniref:Uncharacterized protein n=2 Tax=Saccharomonospora TaxID=1851 RepID=H5X1W9_9PSEU|nr:hypothetical protein SacmaDRAFT_3835 [Saccharomonospora marina XMU15]